MNLNTRAKVVITGVLFLFLVGTFFFAILSAPLTILPSGHYGPDPRFTDRWKALEYTTITNNAAFKEGVKRIRVKSKVKLNKVEKDCLYKMVANFLIAYHGKDFKDFQSFRFALPQGNFTETFDELISETYENSDGSPPDSKRVLQVYWDKVDVPQRYGNKAYWDSVALDGSELNVRRMQIIPNSLKDEAFRRENNGVTEPRPIFISSPSPNALIARDGWVYLANLFVVVKTADQVIRPCYLRAYWEPRNEVWSPWEIVFYQPVAFTPVF